MIKVSIIIVKYKAPELLKRCLKSIPPNTTYEVVVVNNDVNNRGFAKGVNVGVARAKGKYIFLLNPDCVLKATTIENLVKVLEKRPEVGMAGPQLIGADGKPYLSFTKQPTKLNTGIVFSVLSKWWPDNKYSQDYWCQGIDLNQSREVESISGAAMLMRRQEYLEIGKLDERFFMYWEDYDLCRRFLMQGKKIWFESRSKLVHIKEGSTSRESYSIKTWFRQSRQRFFVKHFGIFWGLGLSGWLWLTEEWKLVLILSLGAFLRFWKLPQLMPFLGDQGRDFLAASTALSEQQLPLLGIESSVPRFAQGPLYVWGLMLLMGVGLKTPIAAGMAAALTGLIAIYLVFKLAFRYFSKNTALIASLILATSPLAVTQSRLAFMTNPIPLASYLYLLFLFRDYKRESQLFWLALSFGFLFQFELAAFPLIILIALYVWVNRSKISSGLRAGIWVSLGLLVSLAPQIMYDLTHQFKQLGLFLVWVAYRIAAFGGFDYEHTISPNKLNTYIDHVSTYLSRFWGWGTIWITLFFTLILAVGFFRSGRDYRLGKLKWQTMVLWMWVGVSFLGYLVHSAPSEAYFPVLFLPLVILTADAVMGFQGNFRKILIGLVMVIAIYNSGKIFQEEWYMSTPRNIRQQTTYPYGNPLGQQQLLISKLKEKFGNEPINLVWDDGQIDIPHFLDGYYYLGNLSGLKFKTHGKLVRITLDETGQLVAHY